MQSRFIPEFQNGKLVKLNGQRPEYMSGHDLIRATKQIAEAAVARISELETLLARSLVFDRGAAEEGVEALGGWANMVARVEAYREDNPLPVAVLTDADGEDLL